MNVSRIVEQAKNIMTNSDLQARIIFTWRQLTHIYNIYK